MNSGVQTSKYLDAIKDCFIFHVLEGSPELLAYHCYGDACSSKVLSSDKFHLPFLAHFNQLNINWRDMQNYVRPVFDCIFTGDVVLSLLLSLPKRRIILSQTQKRSSV